LKEVDYHRGYEELDPLRTATQLLNGSKRVAIASRFPNHAKTMEYQKALEAQGISTRIVGNQTGVQDFCFLKHAKELVGLSESTFAFWAGYLGISKNDNNNNNSTTITQQQVRLYTVESPQRKRHFIKQLGTNLVHWTHPVLKDRFHYETYESSRNENIATTKTTTTATTTKASEQAEEDDEEELA
jgi:hypothetical protein